MDTILYINSAQAAMEAYADYLLNPDEIDNELENYKE